MSGRYEPVHLRVQKKSVLCPRNRNLPGIGIRTLTAGWHAVAGVVAELSVALPQRERLFKEDRIIVVPTH